MKSQSNIGRLGLRNKSLFEGAQGMEAGIPGMTGNLGTTSPGCLAKDRGDLRTSWQKLCF